MHIKAFTILVCYEDGNLKLATVELFRRLVLEHRMALVLYGCLEVLAA